MSRGLTVQDVITLLLGLAVLVLAVAVWRLTDSGQADVGEVTQELPAADEVGEVVDEVWLDFYTTAPRSRWRRWRHPDRRELR
ncbi:hypothetical protein [Micromonospora humidisoli]|uniref:Uncharacterized protein n=1 Tax=Micromonospora humidisoli TaxID=2807622 RepID=A0ABS2JCT1_9ACTN|nr:hypothetical protein [Micromonospora humidisoli]MBM7083629.1 hypothetical protein [Micromonospora humidisoli]